MKTKEKVRVAVKKIPHKSRREREHNYFEIAFLSLCLHKNIVHYIDSYLVGDSVWILMEYLEGGTLAEAANAHNFPDNHIAYVAREVISALNFLHSKNYAHRDLKSNNVMMSIKGEIKLIDFGLCADFSERTSEKTARISFLDTARDDSRTTTFISCRYMESRCLYIRIISKRTP